VQFNCWVDFDQGTGDPCCNQSVDFSKWKLFITCFCSWLQNFSKHYNKFFIK